MGHDWSDPEVARRWDRGAYDTNPTRREQLDILVSVLEGLWQPGGWLLDLGCGSGQVEQLIFDRIPDARVVGVDGSPAMTAIARERLTAHLDRFEIVLHDLSALPSLALPDRPYQFTIAVQSLHHLSPGDMRDAYRSVYGLLEPGGLFLLQDRLQVENSGVWPAMRQVWERQDREYGSRTADHEGASFPDHERTVRERGDYPVLLDEHLQWLKGAGFQTACLHLHGHRALLAGAKPA